MTLLDWQQLRGESGKMPQGRRDVYKNTPAKTSLQDWVIHLCRPNPRRLLLVNLLGASARTCIDPYLDYSP